MTESYRNDGPTGNFYPNFVGPTGPGTGYVPNGNAGPDTSQTQNLTSSSYTGYESGPGTTNPGQPENPFWNGAPNWNDPVPDQQPTGVQQPQHTGYRSEPFMNYPDQNPYEYYEKDKSESLVLPIIALVFSYLFGPAGFVLGFFGYSQSKKNNNETGKVLSVISIVVGGISVIMVGLVMIVLFFAAEYRY